VSEEVVVTVVFMVVVVDVVVVVSLSAAGKQKFGAWYSMFRQNKITQNVFDKLEHEHNRKGRPQIT
jgi:hypothetical protein